MLIEENNVTYVMYPTCVTAPPLVSLHFSLLFFCAGRTVISVPPTDQRVIKGTTAILDCNATHDPRVNIRYLIVSLCVYVHAYLFFSVFHGFLCVCKYIQCIECRVNVLYVSLLQL